MVAALTRRRLSLSALRQDDRAARCTAAYGDMHCSLLYGARSAMALEGDSASMLPWTRTYGWLQCLPPRCSFRGPARSMRCRLRSTPCSSAMEILLVFVLDTACRKLKPYVTSQNRFAIAGLVRLRKQ